MALQLPQEASPQSSGLSRDDFLASLGEEAPTTTKPKGRSREEFLSFVGQLYPQEETSGVGQFLGGLGGTLANVADVPALLSKATGLDLPGVETGRAAAESMRGGAQAVYPESVRGTGGLQETALAGLGGTLPMLGVGGVAGAAGKVAGGIGMAAAGAAQSAPDMYWRVLDATGDESKAMTGAFAGMGLGALEAAGLGPLGARLDKASGGAIRQIFMTLGRESIQEGVQAGLQAKVFEGLTGQDVDLWTEMARGAEGGAAVAGLFMTLTGVPLATARRLLRNKPAPGPSSSVADPNATQQGKVAQPGAPDAAQGDPASAPTKVRLAHETEVPPAAPPPTDAAPAAPAPTGKTVAQVSEEAMAQQAARAPQSAPAPTSTPEASTAQAEPASPTEAPAQPGEAGALPQPEDMDPEQLAPDQPPTAEAEPAKTTGIKNKVVERELEEMGLPLPEKEKRKGFVALHAKAKEAFEADRDSGSRLVTELEASPRPTTDEESALLTFEANRLITEREAAEEAFLKDPSEANQARIDEAKRAYGRAADVLDKVGTQTGRALAARKLMMARDYSLAAMERAFEVAKGGEPLTAKETARVKELHEKLAATTKAHEQYVSAAELKRAELEAENAMLRLQKEAKGAGRRSKRKAEIEQTKKELDDILNEIARVGAEARTGLDPKMVALTAKAAAKLVKLGTKSFAQFADQMVARFGESIRPYLQGAWDAGQSERRKEQTGKLAESESPEEVSRAIQKMALEVVESGVKDRTALAKAVHEIIRDVKPEMTLEDTRDAISGYGIYRPLAQGEARRTLRDLKGQMQQVAKLEALQARQPIQKTGFERQDPSPTQKRLAKQVRDLQRQLGLTAKPDRLKALKSRLQNQITDLEKRIATKDFSDKPKPQPVTLDDEAIKLKAAKEDAARLYEKEKTEFERANRTRLQKAKDAALEVARFPRAILSALDVSAPGRQGIFFALGHPIISTKQAVQMFRALRSESVAAEIDAKIKEQSEFARASGLDLAPLEEDMVSRYAQKVPGVRASNRAYSTFLNLQRIHHFNRLVAALPGNPTLADGKVIAKAVNILTGRGAPPKKIAGALDALGTVLWSPRLLISRFQTIAGSPLYRGSWAVKKEIAKDYARFLAGAGALYTLVQGYDELDDEEDISVEYDWRSSDLGKIKIGTVRIDPLGGLSQVTVFVGRTITGEKKSGSGKVYDIRGPRKYGEDDWSDVAKDFLRFKLSPVAAAAYDILTGEQVERDASGKPLPTTAKSVAKNLVTPISMREIEKDVEELGVPKTVALRLIGLFGLGVQNYESGSTKTAKKD